MGIKARIDTLIESHVLPWPVAFSKNIYVITVIMAVSCMSVICYTNQNFTNFVSSVFNGLGTLVALIIAYNADRNESAAIARAQEVEERAQEDHDALLELLDDLHTHAGLKSEDP